MVGKGRGQIRKQGNEVVEERGERSQQQNPQCDPCQWFAVELAGPISQVKRQSCIYRADDHQRHCLHQVVGKYEKGKLKNHRLGGPTGKKRGNNPIQETENSAGHDQKGYARDQQHEGGHQHAQHAGILERARRQQQLLACLAEKCHLDHLNRIQNDHGNQHKRDTCKSEYHHVHTPLARLHPDDRQRVHDHQRDL